MINNLTIASTCWENDYDIILNTPYREKLFPDIVKHKMLIVNNVNDKAMVTSLADRAKAEGSITEFFYSEELSDTVLNDSNFFGRGQTGNISALFTAKPSFKQHVKAILNRKPIQRKYNGYWYSIAPLCAIYKCKTDWLLYFTEDTLIIDEDFSWIEKAQQLMQAEEKYISACPIWNYKIEEAHSQSEGSIGDFWITSGFSDQCFLLNAKKVREIPNLLCEQNDFVNKTYMYYGGNYFERMLNAYMRNHGLKRLVHQKSIYFHKDFSSEWRAFWLERK